MCATERLNYTRSLTITNHENKKTNRNLLQKASHGRGGRGMNNDKNKPRACTPHHTARNTNTKLEIYIRTGRVGPALRSRTIQIYSIHNDIWDAFCTRETTRDKTSRDKVSYGVTYQSYILYINHNELSKGTEIEIEREPKSLYINKYMIVLLENTQAVLFVQPMNALARNESLCTHLL